jgi:hypothetical protein
MKKNALLFLSSILLLATCERSTVNAADLGWKDTPMLPGGRWHVHDSDRPMAPMVKPGDSFSLGAPAPADAIVLFDGKDLSHWAGNKGAPARWKVENGYMEVVKETGDIHSTQEFGDFQLHLEWAEPAPPHGDSQERGNSGVFLHGRFEVQVLDTFNNRTYADGACGAIYGQFPPLVNACKPPGEWQSYDIIFEAPRWDENRRLVKPAYVTVFQNGLIIQDHQEILGDTGHRVLGKYHPYSGKGPLVLQDHENPVRYRNIWLRPIEVR